MNKFQGWDCHPDGKLAVGPLMGWQASVAPMTGLLRLETAQNDDQLRTGQFQAVQLAMTAAQLRELSSLLLRMAKAVESQPKGTAQ